MANNVNVTNRGFEYLAQYLANAAGFTVPSFIGWGGANGYNTSSTALPAAGPTTAGTGQWSDVGPFQEFTETRVNGTPATILNNSVGSGTVGVQYQGTLTASAGESVGESFLVFTATKPAAYALNSNIAATNTTFTVATGTLVNGYYQLNNEVVQITAVTSNTVATTVVRGRNGSTAGTAKTGDVITFGNIPGAGASNPSNGDMFAHGGFQALALNTNDSIQFTWQINVTS